MSITLNFNVIDIRQMIDIIRAFVPLTARFVAHLSAIAEYLVVYIHVVTVHGFNHKGFDECLSVVCETDTNTMSE